MARTITSIKQSILEEKNTYPSLSPILFAEEGGSNVGILNNMADTMAINISIFEQLQDAYKAEMEAVALSAVPGTEAWIQQKVYEFQYDATTAQYIQLIDLVPTYNVIDETLQIITRASVVGGVNGVITIKAAKSDPPVSLSAGEKTALAEYLDILIPAGPNIVVKSDTSDKMYIDADVYYDGQFSASIQTSVEDAINTYFENLDFAGVVLVSKIQDAIQGVTGVRDVVINEVRARADATVFASAVTVPRQWTTIAGYIVGETTASNTISDTINYTAG
jgi:hypothetical protein